MNNITTEDHFKVFKNEALRHIHEFGLYDWRIKILHEDSEGLGSMACCRADC